jgi:Uncharacterised methyltransferase family (DUF6094)
LEMARSAAKLKMGHYPLPEAEARKIRLLLSYPDQASVIDPCIGTGAAFNLITHDATVERYGIELDTRRAEQARATGIRVIQGNAFDAHAKVETFSLLYLNPPYDSEINLTGNRRLERLFLEHTYHWLVPHGILVLVIPFEQLKDCASLISTYFTRVAVFRMEDPESVRFRQIVVLGIRRNMRGAVLEENRRRLLMLTSHDGYAMLAALAEGATAPFSIPASREAVIEYRGIPYDVVEDLLPNSAAWRQVAPMFLPRDETVVGRPITPLHGGHVGLLCTAGLLNGIFGAGDERHIARWRSVKYVTEFREQEEDTRITRRREKWSNELRLIYVSGKTMKLTESPHTGEKGHGECTPENRDA